MIKNILTIFILVLFLISSSLAEFNNSFESGSSSGGGIQPGDDAELNSLDVSLYVKSSTIEPHSSDSDMQYKLGNNSNKHSFQNTIGEIAYINGDGDIYASDDIIANDNMYCDILDAASGVQAPKVAANRVETEGSSSDLELRVRAPGTSVRVLDVLNVTQAKISDTGDLEINSVTIDDIAIRRDGDFLSFQPTISLNGGYKFYNSTGNKNFHWRQDRNELRGTGLVFEYANLHTVQLATGAAYTPTTTPSAPTSGWLTYCDETSGDLNAIYQDGTIKTIVPSP